MGEAIKVLRTYCPFWERTVYELWDGCEPIIPANNYLRSNLVLSDSTLADKAYLLVLFFRFLRRNSLDFFKLSQENLNPYILHFRNELLFRVRRTEAAIESEKSSKSQEPPESFGYVRAHAVLAEVGWLCEWWGLTKTRSPSGANRYWGAWRRKFQSGWNSLPESFNIGIPKARIKFRENHVLEESEVEAIWDYLTAEARPSRPPLLAKHPSGPKRGWSQSRATAWKTSQRKYRERLAWFHRQQMLWAILIGSAMRRSEVPLLLTRDVQFHGANLWISLRVRKSTEHLGRAKSGPRTIFVGWDLRVVSAWQNWSRSRQILIDKWVQNAGEQKHEMFLTNRDGGPLTVDGMSGLFETLNKRFHLFGGEFPEDQFSLHPHAVRHTVEALFEYWGVPHDIRQRHLGHRRPETTDLYGKVYRKTYVDVLSKLGN